MAPAAGLADGTRDALVGDAVRMATDVSYGSLGTFEFLVDADTGRHVFIEANPRLQVEHTVTEEVLGIDIVRAQLELAAGRTLGEVGLDQAAVAAPRGIAVQCRVNMETMVADGTARPGGGVLTAFEVPSGNGYRTDSFGYVGYRTSASFDSLLAKVIVHTPSSALPDALAKADRALAELRVEGVATNTTFLQAILDHPDVRAGRATTRFVDDHMAELVAAAADQAVLPRRRRHRHRGDRDRGSPGSRWTPSTRSRSSTSASPERRGPPLPRPRRRWPTSSTGRPGRRRCAPTCRAPWSPSTWPTVTPSAPASSCS